jgi:hypothetical protein
MLERVNHPRSRPNSIVGANSSACTHSRGMHTRKARIGAGIELKGMEESVKLRRAYSIVTQYHIDIEAPRT